MKGVRKGCIFGRSLGWGCSAGMHEPDGAPWGVFPLSPWYQSSGHSGVRLSDCVMDVHVLCFGEVDLFVVSSGDSLLAVDWLVRMMLPVLELDLLQLCRVRVSVGVEKRVVKLWCRMVVVYGCV